jgi:hypothetical protein
MKSETLKLRLSLLVVAIIGALIGCSATSTKAVTNIMMVAAISMTPAHVHPSQRSRGPVPALAHYVGPAGEQHHQDEQGRRQRSVEHRRPEEHLDGVQTRVIQAQAERHRNPMTA